MYRLLRPGGRAYLAAPERGDTLATFLSLGPPLFSGQVELKEVYSSKVWAAHQALVENQVYSNNSSSSNSSSNSSCNNSSSSNSSNINTSNSCSYVPDIHYPKLVILTKAVS